MWKTDDIKQSKRGNRKIAWIQQKIRRVKINFIIKSLGKQKSIYKESIESRK